MKKRIIVQLITTLIVVGMFSMAQASSITASSIGNFSNAQGGDPDYYAYYNNYNQTNKSYFFTGVDGYGYSRSGLLVKGNEFDVALDTEFSFGKITYKNGVSPYGEGGHADSVDLSFDLTFSGFSDDNPIQFVQNYTFALAFVHTHNYNGDVTYADYLYLPKEQKLATFQNDGKEYTIKFSGFGQPTANGYTEIDKFRVNENQTASANLYAIITAKDIPSSAPEPGTFVLAAFGMLSLAGVMRKRS